MAKKIKLVSEFHELEQALTKEYCDVVIAWQIDNEEVCDIYFRLNEDHLKAARETMAWAPWHPYRFCQAFRALENPVAVANLLQRLLPGSEIIRSDTFQNQYNTYWARLAESGVGEETLAAIA